jgi:hypothetical protein
MEKLFLLLRIREVKILNVGLEHCPEIFFGFLQFHKANKWYFLGKKHPVVLSMQLSK